MFELGLINIFQSYTINYNPAYMRLQSPVSMIEKQTHSVLAEEKIFEEHDEHIKLNKSSPKPYSVGLDFQYQKLLYWVPILAAVGLVVFGVIREEMTEQEKYYCYKTNFLSTNFVAAGKTSDNRQILVNTRYSFKMYVDSYDYGVSKKLAETGTTDPQIINLLGHIVKSGDHALIVGDHTGLETIVAAKVVGNGGHVYSTQHYEYSRNLARKNNEMNGIAKIVTISDKQPLEIASSNVVQVIDTINRQTEPPGFTYKAQTTYADKLDNIIPNSVQLNFAYISTWKTEAKVLEGMREIIKRSPKLVLMAKWSFEKGVFAKPYEEIISFLSKLGYRSYSFKGGSFKQCTLGEFIWEKDLIKRKDPHQQFILFFPADYTLPR